MLISARLLRNVAAGAAFMGSSTAFAASCTLATDSVTPPDAGFMRTLYSVDFEAPTHTAGSWPKEGLGPKEVGFYADDGSLVEEAHRGLPEVVVQPLLDGQAAELNARPQNTNMLDYDDLFFQLGRAADFYTVDFDMVIDDHVNLTKTMLRVFDVSSVNCNIVFNAANDIYMGRLRGSYQFDHRYHVSMVLTPGHDGTGRIHFTLSDATGIVVEDQYILAMEDGSDFGMINLIEEGYENPDANFVQVDNVLIQAGYTELPELPAPEADGSYTLDFNAALFRLFGTFWTEDGFGLLFGDPNNNVYGDDSSTAMRFSRHTRPTLTHQLGLPFSLKQLDLGEYSTIMKSPRTTTFTGVRYDGITVSLNFTNDGVADGYYGMNDLETVYFDDTWTNLRVVQFTPTVLIDNVKVTVDVDIDEDGVEDWVDACLPENASGAAVENAVERTEGCPLLQGKKGGSSGGASGWLTLSPLLLLTRRSRRTSLTKNVAL